MKRILYHGSEKVIEKPTFGFGNPNNDYGLGFYCCSNKELAKEWAARKNQFGYVNKYYIRDDRLSILDLTKSPYDDILYWVTLLLFHRTLPSALVDNHLREIEYLRDKYLLDLSGYDVVIGYRADDSYFRFPEAFVRSEITLKSLIKIFKSGELGKQYVLISKRAFELITFDNYEYVGRKYYDDYYSRKDIANKTFIEAVKNDKYSKDLTLKDLVMKNG